MSESKLLPCPRCGSTDLEEEATGAAEIRGICYQTCWIECNCCGLEGPHLELNDGQGPSDYQLVRIAWNHRYPGTGGCLFCDGIIDDGHECPDCGGIMKPTEGATQ